jgi:hypothetical protein
VDRRKNLGTENENRPPNKIPKTAGEDCHQNGISWGRPALHFVSNPAAGRSGKTGLKAVSVEEKPMSSKQQIKCSDQAPGVATNFQEAESAVQAVQSTGGQLDRWYLFQI